MKMFSSNRGVFLGAAAVGFLVPVLIIAVAAIALFGFGSLFSINSLFNKAIQNPIQSGLILGGIILVLQLFKGTKKG